VLPYQNVYTSNNTAEACLNQCAAFGYPAAGMEYGDECCKSILLYYYFLFHIVIRVKIAATSQTLPQAAIALFLNQSATSHALATLQNSAAGHS
jgi:hypothetical protein